MNETQSREQIKLLKLLVSVVLGTGITVLSFVAFVGLLLFSQTEILWVLLFVFYVSIIIFFILWNKGRSRKKFIPLGISLLCIIIAAIVIKYNIYVYDLPSVEETEIHISLYEPFHDRQMLAKLDEKADYKITGALPVLDGATALYPVYAAFANAVYPENKYNPADSAVLCGKTIGAAE